MYYLRDREIVSEGVVFQLKPGLYKRAGVKAWGHSKQVVGLSGRSKLVVSKEHRNNYGGWILAKKEENSMR